MAASDHDQEQTDARGPLGIRSVLTLREHLQTALAIEHATIPPYFTAWLSIHEGANRDASQIVRSVMLEEMLHLTLVANLMNAVGGCPRLTQPDFVPRYPHSLPHSGDHFRVSIEKLSPAAIETFLRIELPERVDAPPQPDRYRTIGQFYASIADGLTFLCNEMGESAVFCGDPHKQIDEGQFYGSGHLLVVRDLESALRAISEIKEQGEGIGHGVFDEDDVILGDSGGQEPAHYFRFNEIKVGRRYAPGDTPRSGPRGPVVTTDYSAVYPIRPNTRLSDYPRSSEIRHELSRFGERYAALLRCLEEAFCGSARRLLDATAMMFALKNQAVALMRTPSGFDDGSNVGLVFRAD
jgi:hypothetical protein